MNSINFLNSSGVDNQESVSEAAKQQLVLAQQLANQKKEEIQEPFNMLGAEFLKGGLDDGIRKIGKAVAKRTGITALERLGTEDIGRTLAAAGRQVASNVVKKGGKIVADKLGKNIDALVTKGKKFAVNAINRELSSRGINSRVSEDDLNDIESLKNFLRAKKAEAVKAASSVKDSLAEKGAQLTSNLKNVAEAADPNVVDEIRKDIRTKYGKAKAGTIDKIEKDLGLRQSEAEKNLSKLKDQYAGKDVGEGLDDADKASMAVLADLQKAKLKGSVIQKSKVKFADKSIEGINVEGTSSSGVVGDTLTDEDFVSSFNSAIRQPRLAPRVIGNADDLTEAREVSIFDPANKPFKPKDKNNIQREATLDDQDDIENSYVSSHQKAIQKSLREANPVEKIQDDTPDFLQPKVSMRPDGLPDLPDLPGIGTGLTVAEQRDADIIKKQRERVDRGIQQDEKENLGKQPSELYKDDPVIRDPTTLDANSSASLGKTSARVQAKVDDQSASPQFQEIDFTDEEDEGDFDPADLPPPPPEPEPQLIQTETQIAEPAQAPTQAPRLTQTETQTAEPQDPNVALQKQAAAVEESEKAPLVSKETELVGDLKKATTDVGDADLATGGEDIFGDVAEGVLGIASLVLPGLLEHGDNVSQHNALFSSSYQAGVTA